MYEHEEFIELLHENKFGYVGRCTHCNEIQFSFGNVISNMSMKHFQGFVSTLNEIFDRRKNDNTLQEDEEVIINIGVRSLKLIFTVKEFRKVLDLFEKSMLLLKVKEILKD